jgi:uncharacterized DUF497 family protein
MKSDLEWDAQKEQSNLKKHGISLTEAVTALEDEYAITIEDDQPGERRFITIGMDENGRILLVVYTYGGVIIRIISARKATSSERDAYAGENKWTAMA